MKQLNRLIALAITIFLFTIVACSSKPNDEQIQENLNKQITENKEFSGISATVNNGVVTLTGICEGEDCATKAEEKVKETDGVQRVENNIQSNQGTDLTLRTSVQSIISKYEGVQADVTGGVVVLRGSINRNQVQALMNELAALQPKKLDNQLAVK
jgi:osmotically-inducible protein OsmY